SWSWHLESVHARVCGRSAPVQERCLLKGTRHVRVTEAASADAPDVCAALTGAPGHCAAADCRFAGRRDGGLSRARTAELDRRLPERGDAARRHGTDRPAAQL